MKVVVTVVDSAADDVLGTLGVQELMVSALHAPTLRAFAAALQSSAFATKTQVTYVERLNDFLRWLDNRRYPSALTTSQGLNAAADDYITGLRDRGVAASTFNVSLAALDAFGEWLKLGPVSSPRAGLNQITPRTLDAHQQSALLSAAAARPSRDGELVLREYALISLSLSAGPREVELAALDVDDLELNPGSGRGDVRLTSPNGTQRVVPLDPGCVSVLYVYLADRRRTLGPDHQQRALFVGRTRPTRLTSRSIDRIVREVGRSADPPMEVSPGTLRNTCEARLIAEGRNLMEVAVLMGQQQPKMARVRALVPPPQMELELDLNA